MFQYKTQTQHSIYLQITYDYTRIFTEIQTNIWSMLSKVYTKKYFSPDIKIFGNTSVEWVNTVHMTVLLSSTLETGHTEKLNMHEYSKCVNKITRC